MRQLQVKGPSANTPPLTADQLSVNLDWSSLFSPRASVVAGKGITLRLDLTGHQPLLGDLDKTVQKFTSQPSTGGPTPRIDLQAIKLVANTPLGPIEANGQLAMTDADNFTLDLNAPALKLKGPNSEMDLGGLDVHAKAEGATITGTAKLDVRTFTAPGASIQNLKLDLSVDQLAGVLKGHGAASAQQIALKQGGVKNAVASGDLEAAAIDLKKPPGGWITGMHKLQLAASAGPGSLFGAAWDAGVLKANLDPKSTGGAEGELSFSASKLKHDAGAADAIEIGAKLELPSFATTSALTATGIARVRGGALSKKFNDQFGDAVEAPLKDVAPNFAAAAGKTVRQAGNAFDVVLPWSGRVAEDGYSIAALTGAELKAKSGFSAVLDGDGKPQVLGWTSNKAQSWAAAGSLRLSGGGGPQVSLDLAHAEGSGAKLAAAGEGELRAWRVGEDVLSGRVTGLSFEADKGQGKAAGEVVLAATGSLAGGIWTKAQANGALSASWSPTTFVADAPKGLVLSWDRAAYGETLIGAGALRYTPKGHFAERRGEVIAGEGALGALDIPVSGIGYAAHAVLGATNVNWTSDKTVKVAFNSTAPSFTFVDPGAPAPAPTYAGSFTGLAELSDGWRLTGAIDGGKVKTGQASIDALKAKFDLAGKNGALGGSLAGIEAAISDPSPPDKKLFEPVKFSGDAKLASDIAAFNGVFTLAKPGVQLASVSGQHNLKTASGSLVFAPTPIIFQEGGFEPTALSPLLRGPANVNGRVDISGGASWTADALKSNATVELKKLGFALASAGVFEGVSGNVDINDVAKMTSAPNQTITIDKVTLGLPIEKGAIKFQLIGFDAIRIQTAEWPFVGGFLRVEPVDFKFGADKNTVVADAVDWDMGKLVELFQVKDVKLQGSISGKFPVSFSTGSATVDKAVLQASSKGGVIQYSGSTGDAAGQSDLKAKMLFDALKDFHYTLLQAELNGDIAGRMIVALALEGRNPAVLKGQVFKTNITLDSELMNLLNTTNHGDPTVNAVIGKITGATPD
ncbi:MAG: YdbH domain-containing protein [Alphaproteobacteria bacterium]